MSGKNIEGAELTALGILAVVMIVLGLMVVLPFVYLGSLSNEVEVRTLAIKRLQLQAAQISKSLQDKQQQVKQAGQGEKLLLNGDTTGIAGANLQRLVTDLVARNNGTSRSFQVLSPEKEKNLTRISMSLAIEVDIESFQKILHALEAGAPLIFIEDIVVQTKGNSSGQGSNLQKQMLEVTMKLSGYLTTSRTI